MEKWRIPMSKPLVGEEEARAVYEVVLSGWLSAGPKVPAFEKAFSAMVGTQYAVAFCNGTVALHAILVALGIGPGDEVLVPDITFVSSATSVVHAGAVPVFVDVQRSTLNMDPKVAARRITARTKAMMVVHYAGQAADMDGLLEIGKRCGLMVIEDAAEAHGAQYKKRMVGSFGRAAMFSFTPAKNMTTGEGGLVTTDDGQLAERLSLLRNHGSRITYAYEFVGYNYRMTEMQAAMGIEQLKRLPSILQRKQRMAQALSSSMEHISGLEPPATLGDRTHPYQMFTVKVDPAQAGVTRDQLRERLASKGIQTRVCFPPLHQQHMFERCLPAQGEFPVSTKLGETILSLPFHSSLSDDDLCYMTESLAAAVPARR